MNVENFDELEKRFLNEEFENDNGFEIKCGKGNIMLSAPHSVNQFRNGKNKTGEYRTGVILQLLSKYKNINIIYKTNNNKDDANYDENCLYKNELKKFIIENKINILFDLHISSEKRDFDIDLGTNYGKNLCGNKLVLDVVLKKFKENGYDVKIDSKFPASNPNTVSAFVSKKCSIAALQLEVNWRCLKEQEELIKFINILEEVVESLRE